MGAKSLFTEIFPVNAHGRSCVLTPALCLTGHTQGKSEGAEPTRGEYVPGAVA